jgi:hypothetical protein
MQTLFEKGQSLGWDPALGMKGSNLGGNFSSSLNLGVSISENIRDTAAYGLTVTHKPPINPYHLNFSRV